MDDRGSTDLRRRLRWPIVLGDEQNVTVAAAVLGLSQPTLSRALARLEAELGVRLFDRQGRSIRLNAAGAAFLDHLRSAEAALAAAELAARRIAGRAVPPIRLGFLHSFGTWLVPELIKAHRALDAGGDYQLQQGAAGLITAAVTAGELDIGIVSPRPEAPTLRWQLLMRQRLHLLVPDDHQWAGGSPVPVEALRGEPQVVMSAGFGMRTILDSLCAAAGFTAVTAIECQDLSTVRALVGAGLGVALVPDEGRALPPGTVALELRAEAAAATRREVGLIWRRDAGGIATAFADRARTWSASARARNREDAEHHYP